MKLEYKILWLDDQIQSFIDDEVIQEVEEYLIEQGFQPNIITVSRSEDFFKKLDDSFDLILTDYHLNDLNGDEVIKKLRSQDYSVMSEVLFYTAKADLKDTDKINRVSFLETNTLLGNHREEVLKATTNLIGLTIKKFQNIIAMRGMIMQETSSLDVEMENILHDILEKSENPNELINQIKSRYIKSNNDFNKQIEKLVDTERILRQIGASHRWRAIKRSLDDGNIKSLLNEYEKQIISVRNKFAHAELIVEGDRQFFKDRREDIDFNEEFCKDIRENIIKHKSNLVELKTSLED
jgi:CheY-like chemotaxis protein|tara:strand:+ start:2389 stop:3273 length:885 start_codon:yes stop_codon:yes gene_type:complete